MANSTAGRRRTSTLRSRRTTTHRRSARSPDRRRGSTRQTRRTPGRSRQQSGWGIGKTLIAGAALVILMVAGYFYSGDSGATANAADVGIARQIVFTAPTANDAAVTLPKEVRTDLEAVGLAHQKVSLTRVDSTGETTTSIVDLTPESDGHVFSTEDRALEVIDAKITTEIEQTINSSSATTGGRALYAGLTTLEFTPAPVYLVSALLDTFDPLDFRSLNWAVPAEEIVDRMAGSQPVMSMPVTVVVVPVAGDQEQLGRAQKTYRNDTWTTLLTSAGATRVTYLEANGSAPTSTTVTPTVPVPDLPDTPILPVPDPEDPTTVTCTIPDTYFAFGKANLTESEQAEADLAPCIRTAVDTGATFTLDGWASYEGQLDPDGKPATDDPWNRDLSELRVNTIATLLIDKFGVPPNDITARIGHGNIDQPHPDDPRSEKNRVVIITYQITNNK